MSTDLYSNILMKFITNSYDLPTSRVFTEDISALFAVLTATT
jgi:hypothetical protein